MKLKFIINKKYLLVHALKQNNIIPFTSWTNLKYKLWQMNRDITCLLEGKPEWIFINENYYKSSKFNKNLNQIINYALRTKEFKKLYRETEKYLKFVKNQ